MSRMKGTPNKVTRDVRETIQSVLEKRVDRIPKLLDQLEPKEELEMMVKLLVFIVPKPIPKQEAENATDWGDFAERLAKAMRYNS